MTTSQLCICLAIVAYLAVMLGIGIWCAKKNNSVDDFYLGGRKLGPFVTAMSAGGKRHVLLAADGTARRRLSQRFGGRPAGLQSAWR